MRVSHDLVLMHGELPLQAVGPQAWGAGKYDTTL